MRTLRPYQQRASAQALAALSEGKRVLVVAPPAAGKTTIGGDVVVQMNQCLPAKTLWVAHRIELVEQAAERLREEGLRVGIISGDGVSDPDAPIQVATIQTLLRVKVEGVGFVVLDEVHHYSATDWRQAHEAYPHARLLGLTATPQRDDGQGLGDIFNHLVVAATYSELLASGHICPCPRENVLAPPPTETGYDLALDPLKAWKRYGQERSTLAFASNVADALRYSKEFHEAGIVSAVLDGHDSRDHRKLVLDDFASGHLRVLWSVGILTEGTDLPRTAAILLGRECSMQRTFLQITGRGLRTHKSKSDLIIIDLVGATLRHGLPAEDRIYSLTDPEPIRRTSPQPMRQCLECGHTIPSFFRRCPDCGYVHGPRGRHAPKIWDLELAAVYEAENTPADAKRKELLRLVGEAVRKGYSLKWVSKKYRDEFGGAAPDLSEFSARFPGEEAATWAELRKIAADKGYHWKWAEHRFVAKYGHPPGRVRV
jgi:DNA repair protein RadD